MLVTYYSWCLLQTFFSIVHVFSYICINMNLSQYQHWYVDIYWLSFIHEDLNLWKMKFMKIEGKNASIKQFLVFQAFFYDQYKPCYSRCIEINFVCVQVLGDFIFLFLQNIFMLLFKISLITGNCNRAKWLWSGFTLSKVLR